MERSGSLKAFHIERTNSFIDEEELQKRELVRLLGTAKDEDRKRFIQNALSVLEKDSPQPNGTHGNGLDTYHQLNSPKKNASLAVPPFFKSGSQSHLFADSLQNAPLDLSFKRPTSASSLRPTSAHIRRTSSNLDAIPEHRALPFKSKIEEKDGEILLTLEHVSDILGSSFDPKNPLSKLFNDPRNDRPSGAWVCTGLAPQFVTIYLRQSWIVKKIDVETFGVSSLSLVAVWEEGSVARSVLPTTRTNDTFSYQLDDEKVENGRGSSSGSYATPTRQIIFKIERATEPFFGFIQLNIRAAHS